jgi:hypothetical protein
VGDDAVGDETPGDETVGDGLGAGGDVTELGRLTRQPWLVPLAGNASASPSAIYRARVSYPAEV